MNHQKPTSTLAVLFADIGNSTVLYQQFGDKTAHKMVKDCLVLMRQMVEQARGDLLRTVGDAVLASFEDCDSAFEAAEAIHIAMSSQILSVRVGFHWGDVIPDQGDVYGNTVNIAARVADLATVGEIMTTGEVVQRLSPDNKTKAQLLNRSMLKGLARPLDFYRLHWRKEETEQVTRAYTIPILNNDEYVLLLTSGDQQITLTNNGESVSIGRGDNNSIQTSHNAASRVHATVERKSGKFVLTDCSTNGTYVSKNGGPPVYVHRDVITLDGIGVITMGFTPNNLPASKSGTVIFTATNKT